MAVPDPALGCHTDKNCYFTLENGDEATAVHTCGDVVRAKVHIQPQNGESLSLKNFSVNFKCEVRTVISTGSGKDSHTHRYSINLFCFSTPIIGQRTITVNAHQAWDIAFEFPWAIVPHPTHDVFRMNPAFPHESNHRLPPTWQQRCRGYVQTVQYYLESKMIRHGGVMDHNDKHQLPLLFCPPLDLANPPPALTAGPRETIMRTSRLLDPSKRNERHTLRDKVRDLFTSSNQIPSAIFGIKASAPTVCCVGDSLPITLQLNYDENSSTAPIQPELTISSLYVRLNDFVQYRIPSRSPFASYELVRQSDGKIVIAQRFFAQRPVYDGMSLDELASLCLHPSDVGISFATFTISRQYVLKVSATFNCGAKDYDVVLLKHELTVHPARSLYRPPPWGNLSPEQPIGIGENDSRDWKDALPPYESTSVQGSS
ncbi:MAG: hypothetical protein Q9219_005363 [cf. Caloplaca sp. 3 TL-2023]